MQKKYKILTIILAILGILILGIVLAGGSILLDSPILVILTTVDFIGTEHEYREIVGNTKEAQLFIEIFPTYTTEYYLEIGKRTLILLNEDEEGKESKLRFKQTFDRTISISHWCELEHDSYYGFIDSIDEMKSSDCFNKDVV